MFADQLAEETIQQFVAKTAWQAIVMRVIPKTVVGYLAELVMEQRAVAYLATDREGCLNSWGGNLGRYGINRLQMGRAVEKQVYFLEGLLPADKLPIRVPFVSVNQYAFFDIHILRVDSLDWILLVDSSLEACEIANNYLTVIGSGVRTISKRRRSSE